MAQLPQAANSEENQSQGGFEVLPADDYVCVLKKSEWKDAKKEGNRFIYMEFVVVEGEYKGGVFIERMNLVNSNSTAVRIANGKMNQLCAACLLSDIEDTDELHGIPVMLTVTINPNDDNDFAAQNEIKKFSNVDGESFDAPWK